jgi:hypothetical protein
MNEGYIIVARGFFDGPLWGKPRVYSEAEAWLDLIVSAAWKEHKRSSRGNAVVLKRGEILASIRFLARKWGWSEKQVRGMLSRNQKAGALRAQRKTSEGQVYLLVNYDKYQSPRRGEDTPGDDYRAQRGHSEGTVRARRGHSEGTRKNTRKTRKSMERREETTATSACAEETLGLERARRLLMVEGALREGDLTGGEAEAMAARIRLASTMDELGGITREMFALTLKPGRPTQASFEHYGATNESETAA